MKRESRQMAVFFLSMYAAAFFLNFCWESWHGLWYQAHRGLPAGSYVPMMVRMALLDAAAVVAMYLFTALLSRRIDWLPDARSIALFCLAGAVPASAVEYVAVVRLHAWAYLSTMPTLFGVGLSPLLQLPLTGLAGLLAARGIAGILHDS
jgi:hypothetical protein